MIGDASTPGFEIDPRLDAVLGGLVLRDPWGDYCRVGETIPICFVDESTCERAVVVGRTAVGATIVTLDGGQR